MVFLLGWCISIYPKNKKTSLVFDINKLFVYLFRFEKIYCKNIYKRIKEDFINLVGRDAIFQKRLRHNFLTLLPSYLMTNGYIQHSLKKPFLNRFFTKVNFLKISLVFFILKSLNEVFELKFRSMRHYLQKQQNISDYHKHQYYNLFCFCCML